LPLAVRTGAAMALYDQCRNARAVFVVVPVPVGATMPPRLSIGGRRGMQPPSSHRFG
jgi:hypothetical protein